jgi:MFS transporter, DHA1 family, tetracycline resistance protein
MGRQSRLALMPLMLIIFIDTLCWFIVAPVLLRLYMPGHESILPAAYSTSTRNLLYGVTMALPPLAFMITTPFLGILSDRIGRKRVLVLCLSVALLGFVLPILGIASKALWLLMLGRFVGGLSTSSQPIAQAAIADYADHDLQKSRLFSFIALSMTLGLLLGPIIGGDLSNANLVSWFSPLTPFYVGAILAIFNLFFVWKLYRPVEKTRQTNVHWIAQYQLLLTVLKHRRLLGILLSFFALEFAWSVFYQSSFISLSSYYHLSPEDTGHYAAFAGVSMCIGLAFVYPIIIQFIQARHIALISLGVMSLALIALLALPGIDSQWIFVAPLSLFVGTCYVALLTLISSLSHRHHQGWSLSLASVLLALAWFITGYLSGLLSHISIHLPTILALIATLVALCVFIMSRGDVRDVKLR